MGASLGKVMLAALGVIVAVIGLLAAQVVGKADQAAVDGKADKSVVESMAQDIREIRQILQQMLRELPRQQGRR